MKLDLNLPSYYQTEADELITEVSRHLKVGKLRRRIGRIAQKYRTLWVASGTSIYMTLKTAVYRANADSIFKPAQDAMTCIINDASTAGVTNTVLTNLPFILFTFLTIIIFSYFVYTLVHAISTYGQGQEVTHVIQQPLFTFICVILLFIGEALLFGQANGCGNG